MNYLFLLGRLLYGGFFLNAAYGHLVKPEGLAAYAKMKGVPSPMLAVRGSGLLILLGSLGIILGIYVNWAVLALALFLIPVSFMMHAYWKDTDPNMAVGNRVNFWKNMALLGAALMFLFIPQPWIYSLAY